jgi:hypothetical protein
VQVIDSTNGLLNALPNVKASCHRAAGVPVADREHELARVTEFTKQAFAFLSRALAPGIDRS